MRKARLEKGIGLRELSRKAGIDHTRLSKIERGFRPPPELSYIISMGEVLETEPTELARLAGVPDYFLQARAAVEAANVLQGKVVNVSDKLLVIQVGESELEIIGEKPPQEKIKVSIRPEEITLYKKPEALVGTSARNRLAGTILEISPYKTYNHALLGCGGFKLKVAVTDKSINRMGLKPGVKVFASFKATAANLSTN